MSAPFARLVRFKDPQGQVHYGEAPAKAEDLVGAVVPVYDGKVPWNLTPSESSSEIAEVLCPLPWTPLIYGIGLNYKQHIKESGHPAPTHPVIFTKPPDALAGPYEDVPVNPECPNMDYEGELCAIIGKDCKNLSLTENYLDYILGFTAGNDVSCRYWQMPPQSGNQHGYAKSFDKFAPIGPVIVSAATIGSKIDDLELITTVNGEKRQNTLIGDLLFSVRDCLSHLSRGTTLRKGTVIMTGTPMGVAAFMSPPAWLKDGDVVGVEIEGIGTLRNKMVFEK
ncbi:MAG: hypothetical protein M1819_000926 [Sarea resinae]|nr:MAG: hypothetical protein M1819_000926 [Sarea resinae]